MRISDWTSDVCSSDLYHRRRLGTAVAVLQCAQVAKAVAEPRAFETFHPQAVADCRGLVACSLLLPGRGGRAVEHGQGRQGRGQQWEARSGGKEWAGPCISRWSPH